MSGEIILNVFCEKKTLNWKVQSFFVNHLPKIDSEFKNFVKATQSESGRAIQKKNFFIFSAFFACILDSNMLKDAHVVVENSLKAFLQQS